MHQPAMNPPPPVTSTVRDMGILRETRVVYGCILQLMAKVYSRKLTRRKVGKKAEPRRRNAAATRAAILASARAAFVRSGYDGAGVREIAAGAGVTAMLVNRYFGSKERLFAEVAAETMAAPV